jgi:carbonic anhydrase/acetyltransferase-like protein (isoleucine patch superfamily)
MILPFDGQSPQIPEESFIAPSADVIGDVRLGERTSVWFQAVIRADIAPITIGEMSNIQDGCVLHVDRDVPVEIGSGVTVGHGAVLHSCTIGDGTLVGMGAIVLSGAKVGPGCIVGAGALIPPGKEIAAGFLVLGSPGKVTRMLTGEERASLAEHAARYWGYACRYR